MKKTLTVNLGGTVYHIDEDAYNLLDNYLNNLRYHSARKKEPTRLYVIWKPALQNCSMSIFVPDSRLSP